MTTIPPDPPLVIRQESQDDPVTFDLHRRTLDIFPVTEAELVGLTNAGDSLDTAFFGIAVGAAISLWTTVTTVQLSDRAFAAYLIAAITASAGSVFFGIRMALARARSRKLIGDIRKKRSAVPAA